MEFRLLLILFLILKPLGLFFVYLSQRIIPYLGFFPYKEVIEQYKLPTILSSFANFDGAHYLLIAKQGYLTYQQAFFPFYPLLIRWISPLFFNNHLLTALVISNFAFIVGLYFLSNYLYTVLGSKKIAVWTIILLIAFPTSFFFGAVYTEGLFLMVFAGTLYFLKKENYLIAAIFAFAAAVTKLMGVFLIIPLALHFYQNSSLRQQKNIAKLPKLILLTAPLLGLFSYSAYLWKNYGDPLFFLNSQWAFGANRSSKLILLPQVIFRYLKIFTVAQINFQYLISVFEFVTFILIFSILILDLIKNLNSKVRNYNLIGINFFSLINLVLPTLTGTFSSIPRYALFSVSFLIYLAAIENTNIKKLILIGFLVLHIVILGFFIQGYFVS